MKAVPQDRSDYKPDPNSMSAFDLAWHIVATESRIMRSIPKCEFYMGPIEKATNWEQLFQFFEETGSKDLAAILEMTPEQLAKVMDFRGVFQLPAVSFVDFCIHHTIHHRGQLSVYLRPMGARVPSMYGESYDDAQTRKAASASE